jgi:hypothetical protein
MDKNEEWNLYYITVVGWSLHPGYNKPGTKKLTLEDCVKIATEMQKEKPRWVGEQQ